MTKLLKLFPVSKLAKSPAKLLLAILLYLVINVVAASIINTVISMLMLPLLIFAFPYIGWIAALLCLPLITLYINILSYVNAFALSINNIYMYAGIVITFIAYAKSDDETTAE